MHLLPLPLPLSARLLMALLCISTVLVVSVSCLSPASETHLSFSTSIASAESAPGSPGRLISAAHNHNGISFRAPTRVPSSATPAVRNQHSHRHPPPLHKSHRNIGSLSQPPIRGPSEPAVIPVNDVAGTVIALSPSYDAVPPFLSILYLDPVSRSWLVALHNITTFISDEIHEAVFATAVDARRALVHVFVMDSSVRLLTVSVPQSGARGITLLRAPVDLSDIFLLYGPQVEPDSGDVLFYGCSFDGLRDDAYRGSRAQEHQQGDGLPCGFMRMSPLGTNVTTEFILRYSNSTITAISALDSKRGQFVAVGFDSAGGMDDRTRPSDNADAPMRTSQHPSLSNSVDGKWHFVIVDIQSGAFEKRFPDSNWTVDTIAYDPSLDTYYGRVQYCVSACSSNAQYESTMVHIDATLHEATGFGPKLPAAFADAFEDSLSLDSADHTLYLMAVLDAAPYVTFNLFAIDSISGQTLWGVSADGLLRASFVPALST